jgi:hypothetical protein
MFLGLNTQYLSNKYLDVIWFSTDFTYSKFESSDIIIQYERKIKKFTGLILQGLKF